MKTVNLSVSVLPGPPGSSSAVAFSISRRVGSAVVRNRVRRRLRELLSGARLPPGTYLVVVQPAARSATFADLSADVAVVAAKVREQGARAKG